MPSVGSVGLAGGETRGLKHHGWSQMANGSVIVSISRSRKATLPGDLGIAIRRLRKGMRDIRDRAAVRPNPRWIKVAMLLHEQSGIGSKDVARETEPIPIIIPRALFSRHRLRHLRFQHRPHRDIHHPRTGNQHPQIAALPVQRP